MKKIIFTACLLLSTVSIISCTASKMNEPSNSESQNSVAVSGTVTHIENGKDGYMATVKNSSGKEYIITISMVNLQKSGIQFKRYNVGDTITVTGPSWKDEQGKVYITAEKLN
ncbi:hypothetical protein MKJ01_15105 [Chryseobacterium sp. SSA4.19]|uniref:hypothetical protein n=1 Tax=Chryseobacterium sp. SSA4.19 TaxID=2919915 RepID=UPI001F4E0DAA|nr:hypothetical protein [Chryseobacterium sp. SSA4.19]MCJ8155095.1 hypothetical protein [Chryseobacterium sp. SSA4.19]